MQIRSVEVNQPMICIHSHETPFGARLGSELPVFLGTNLRCGSFKRTIREPNIIPRALFSTTRR